MNKKELLDKLSIAEKYFKDTKYRDTVSYANRLYEMGSYRRCESELNRLPSREQLLAMLVEKLKRKSVYRTLKKIQEGCAENSLTTLKGLSSLLTHTVIEVEQGGKEFQILVPSILEEINKVVYNLL